MMNEANGGRRGLFAEKTQGGGGYGENHKTAGGAS